jgi:hypothetical protein
MMTNRKSTNNNNKVDVKNESITLPTKQVKEFSIPKLSTPLTLDEQFSEWLTDISACFLFLERYIDQDEALKNLLQLYHKSLKPISLDTLCDKAGMDKGNFRRLIIATIDYLCSDDADMAIRLSKGSLVRKSLAIAMDESLVESYAERKAWLEFLGYRVVNKNTSVVNVQVGNTTNNVVQQNNVVNGLPSFASTINEGEKVVNETLKEMIQGTTKQLSAKPLTIDVEEEDVINVEVEKETVN